MHARAIHNVLAQCRKIQKGGSNPNPRQITPWSHHTSPIITDCNHSCTPYPRLDLLGFWRVTETDQEVRLDSAIGMAPVNKLVFLTWLLWLLRSFIWVTLH